MSQNDTKKIGWIGTGVMGQSMAGHLLDAGYSLTIYTRTKSKADSLFAKGAMWVDTPRGVAEAAEIVFTIVGYPADVEEVYLGADGILSATNLPNIIVDMTTSSPALARRIAEAALAQNVQAIDAPVSGGDIGAQNATLSIMVGGDAAAVSTVHPLFDLMGKKVTHLGGSGAGQHTKMVNQTLIASMMIGVCEGLLYAHKAGLDPLKVIEAVGSGAAGSWSINNLGPRMIARDFEPGFYVEHFIKDMRIALDEARQMQLALPGLALAEQLYNAVQAQGFGRKGTQALLLALEQMAGVDAS